jgi:hypothetical protein
MGESTLRAPTAAKVFFAQDNLAQNSNAVQTKVFLHRPEAFRYYHSQDASDGLMLYLITCIF